MFYLQLRFIPHHMIVSLAYLIELIYTFIRYRIYSSQKAVITFYEAKNQSIILTFTLRGVCKQLNKCFVFQLINDQKLYFSPFNVQLLRWMETLRIMYLLSLKIKIKVT